MNKIIAEKKRHKWWNILKLFFKYQNPLFLFKSLIRDKQAKNEKLVNNINDELIDLRNAIIRKEILENKNPNKIPNIVEKILEFNNQQKDKGIKILTLKQMLQRLPIALAQVNGGNTSEIIYFLNRAKEIAKKVELYNGFNKVTK